MGDRYIVEQHSADFGCYVRSGESLVSIRTRYQDLEVVETSLFGRTLLLDHAFMTSEKDEFFYHENVVHVPAIAHSAPERALIVGGGDGGAAKEIVKHNTIKRIVLAELDESVIEASRRLLPRVHQGVFDDPRLDLRVTDGKAYVEQTKERFDLIVLDLTDPIGPSQALYTREFYASCKRILTEGGLLSLPAENPITRPKMFNRIVKTLRAEFRIVRPYLVYIPLWGTWWALASASDQTDPAALSELEVEQRMAMRSLSGLKFYNGATHHAAFALPNFVRSILDEEGEIISAESPPLDLDISLNQTRRLVVEER